MYWTNYIYGEIVRANMDGTSSYPIVTGQRSPAGIVIDYEFARLYWVDYYDNVIKSSDLDGQEVYTVANLGSSPRVYPGGIDILNDRSLYWTTESSGIYRCNLTTACDVIEFVYTPSVELADLKLVHSSRQPVEGSRFKRRLDPCESDPCSDIWALRPNSYSCLCPSGMEQAEDGHTCK